MRELKHLVFNLFVSTVAVELCGSISMSLEKLRVKSTFLQIGVDFLPSESDRGNSREGKTHATVRLPVILLLKCVIK